MGVIAVEISKKDKSTILNLYFNKMFSINKIVEEMQNKYSYLDIKFLVLRVINGDKV